MKHEKEQLAELVRTWMDVRNALALEDNASRYHVLQRVYDRLWQRIEEIANTTEE